MREDNATATFLMSAREMEQVQKDLVNAQMTLSALQFTTNELTSCIDIGTALVRVRHALNIMKNVLPLTSEYMEVNNDESK